MLHHDLNIVTKIVPPPLSPMNLNPYKDFALKLADTAAERILPWYGKPDCGLEQKEDETPVTRADREAEASMREMITQAFP